MTAAAKLAEEARRRQMARYLLKQQCLCLLHGGPIEDPSWEHLIPRARGGRDWHVNLALSCRRCNNKRGKAPLTEEQLERVLAWFGARKHQHALRDRLQQPGDERA